MCAGGPGDGCVQVTQQVAGGPGHGCIQAMPMAGGPSDGCIQGIVTLVAGGPGEIIPQLGWPDSTTPLPPSLRLARLADRQ